MIFLVYILKLQVILKKKLEGLDLKIYTTVFYIQNTHDVYHMSWENIVKISKDWQE